MAVAITACGGDGDEQRDGESSGDARVAMDAAAEHFDGGSEDSGGAREDAGNVDAATTANDAAPEVDAGEGDAGEGDGADAGGGVRVVDGECSYAPSAPNLIANHDFATSIGGSAEPGVDLGSWASEYHYMGINPTRLLGDHQIAVYRGMLDFPLVKQRPFEGDREFGVEASDTYAFADGGDRVLDVWEQRVTDLATDERYLFSAYVSNVLVADWRQEPIAVLYANGVELARLRVPYDGSGGSYSLEADRWSRISGVFSSSTVAVTLRVRDEQDGGTVNDVGITALSLMRCE